MSGKREKALRRALNSGVSKAALRDQREFEAVVARAKLSRAVAADQPIIRRDGRRRALALAGLLILAALLFAIVLNVAGRQ